MIRNATKNDLPQVLPLVMDIFKDMELPVVQQYPEKEVLERLNEAAQDPRYRYHWERAIVAEDAGEILGAAFGYPAEDEPAIDTAWNRLKTREGTSIPPLFEDPEVYPHEWYLDTLIVSRNARGHGIGTKLLQAVPQVASASGKHLVGLNVDQKNPKAEKLYRQMGFQKVGEMIISAHRYNHLQQPLK
ncbi:GNAT family N-acetyltransferase [Enterococcus hirae]|nr:GNAT family N-acetyltransferase [Enterococcus hirae]